MGIRTVVYFKGCGLGCKWCHNPETLSAEKELMFAKSKCIRCGRCVRFGKSADVCPSGAIHLVGREVTVDELWGEVKKDIHFYQQSGGGVTLSGGECLLQSQFAAEFLKKCKAEGIHSQNTKGWEWNGLISGKKLSLRKSCPVFAGSWKG